MVHNGEKVQRQRVVRRLELIDYSDREEELLVMSDHKQSLSIILACSCLCAIPLFANRILRASGQNSTSSAEEISNVRAAFLAHTTKGAGTTVPAKLCSAVHAMSFNWRDTIIVPDDWRVATCQNFANSLGGSHYQLGCANPGSFSWGNNEGSLPPENQCHW